jgi:competence protein ComEA
MAGIKGGVVMRRIIGALVLFLAVAFFRGGDVLLRWLRAPEAEVGLESTRRITTNETASPGRSSGVAVPRGIPADYIRTPLEFLSTAPVDSLILLSGIGPVLADRIVGARNGKGSFTRWEDLLAIKGIGPKTLDRLKRLTDGAN